MEDFRFSFCLFGIGSHDDFVARCRRGERLGYDAVYAPDHLGGPAPFPALVAAAEATQRMRVGTMVVNTGIWNPHLLAREVATVDKLTDGRLEIGLGAGHMRWEFDATGIAWQPLSERTDNLVATIDTLGQLFAGDGYPGNADKLFDPREPEPSQRQGFGGYGPPLLIGGASERVLRLAAERADIVGFSGTRQLRGAPLGTLGLLTAEETKVQVRFVREHARDDEQEFQSLIQFVQVTNDRRALAEQLVADKAPYLTVDEVLDCPFVLIGTVDQIAEQLRECRDQYGFFHVSVHEPYFGAFAPVVERLRG